MIDHDDDAGRGEDRDRILDAAVSRRKFLTVAGLAGAGLTIGGGLGLLSGCGDTTSTTTSSAATATTAATTGATTAATTGASTSGVLKLGHVTDYSIPPMVDGRKGLEAVVAGANDRGGWDVGGTKYKLELISYDNKSDPATAVSAVTRLLEQDKVPVIFGDITAGAWATATEAAKVLALVETPLPDIFKPEYRYTFSASTLPISAPVGFGYLPIYLGKEIGKYVVVGPDNAAMQGVVAGIAATAGELGQTVEPALFAPATTDFSAVATKVLSMNPDAVMLGGGNQVVAQLGRALKAAGFQGTLFIFSDMGPQQLAELIPLTELEGFVAPISGWDTDNPSQLCAQVKADFEKMFGSMGTSNFEVDRFFLLEAAVQQAGSVDPAALAELLSKGMTFEGPHGEAKMVSRPDQGITDRNVCSITQLPFATLIGGKVSNVKAPSLDDVEKYTSAAWKAKS